MNARLYIPMTFVFTSPNVDRYRGRSACDHPKENVRLPRLRSQDMVPVKTMHIEGAQAGRYIKSGPTRDHPGRFELEKGKGWLEIDGPEPLPCLHIAN